MLADAWLIAAKDLRLEWRSRVTLAQIAPFAVLVLVLFGFALDPDRGLLAAATPGLYWVAVLFASVLAVQRAFAVESTESSRDILLLSGVVPSGVFLGKALAISVQLLALEVLLLGGVAVFYGATLRGWLLLAVTVLSATAGIAAAGSLYGVLATGLRVRDTLVPLLMLPVLAPVLLGATRAFEAALEDTPADGWPWAGLLVLFALAYLGAGVAAYGSLLEET
ncbi:MAG: heme exporter protein CcmB [Acidimicrobiia bacterium]|nr:heme exporter protein CcmB [Acidimicrobiia bacterium]